MNYNLVQTTYFLIFTIIAVTLYIVTPVLYSSFSDASDTYARSQIRHIQGEIFFIDSGYTTRSVCYSGGVGDLVQDLIEEYGKKVVCRVDSDRAQMIVYAQLRNGNYHMVGGDGVSCDTQREPTNIFRCKDTFKIY